MLILKKPSQAETKVKNSRFLAEIFTVSSAQEAKELWQYRKQTYDNGGHIVYAFVIGPQQNLSGCSDDGEPSGTAGRPVLAVLKGSMITNAMITVARWFGGTKLGTGGLVHAYTEAAQAALAGCETIELVPMTGLSFSVTYPMYENVRRKLSEFGFEILSEDFADGINISGELPSAVADDLCNVLGELSNGKIKITVTGS